MGKEVVNRTTGEVVESDGNGAAPLSTHVVMQFVEIVRLIPTDDNMAMDRIAEQILNAGTWEDLNAPWQADKTEHLIGVEQRIERITPMESGYADGLPFFLVVKGVDLRSGDEITWTSGSLSMCMQLAKAFHAGWLPIKAKIVQAERPSKAGYYPQHLTVLDRYTVDV